jgi:outer membrane protein assembly factor BamB
LYEKAWSAPVDVDATVKLFLGIEAPVLLIGGPEAPLEARSLADGRITWTTRTPVTPPFAASSGLLLAIGGGRLYAFDTATGRTRWNVAVAGDSRGPTVSGDTVLFSAGATLFAHRVADGSPVWHAELGAEALTPVATGGSLAVVALSDNAVIALDLATGAVRWRVTRDLASAAVAVGDTRVYHTTTNGKLCGLLPRGGREDWCYPLNVTAIGAPLVDERFVYVALLDNTVQVLNRSTGSLTRRDDLPSRPIGPPVFGSGDEIVVPLVTGEFAIRQRATGKDLGRVSPPPTAPPATDATQLFVTLPETVESFAVASDGTSIATLTIAPGARRTLTVYRRTSAAAVAPGGQPAAAASIARASRFTPSSIRSGDGAENDSRR